ncbi:MAG TPA: folylpolyglutamate synthase/dihydrofolate synthase family protein [Parvularculaceae bacterium]|nr:folylpolyglutamate synthase/dihydrofolate synthase family protein [Parvularculaceae bacterium]
MNAVEAALERVALRRPALIDLGLGRVFRTLARLDDPHRRAPPVFHIAGTNGKGSTLAYLKAILEASGAEVHTFISPHLVRYNERITLAGREISDEAFLDVIERVDRAAGDDDLTFFETITCAAFLAFAETPADFLLLEVGLGGRLDATNVLEKPLAAIVTPIALDHQNFLGTTLAEIAGEKAGIFRAGAPAVIGLQAPEAMAALLTHAQDRDAAPFAFGRDWNAWSENGRLVYQDDNGLSDLAPPRLMGAHQFYNAGLAVAAIKRAALPIADDMISDGVSTAFWPARLQRLKSGPLFDLLDRACDCELWLDGGHNPHAALALAQAMADLEEKSAKTMTLIVGMQENKDADGFFAAFSGLAAAVFAVQADHSGARAPADVAAAAERAGIPAHPCASVDEALRHAIGTGEQPLRVLICGSLYLAGEILAQHK